MDAELFLQELDLAPEGGGAHASYILVRMYHTRYTQSIIDLIFDIDKRFRLVIICPFFYIEEIKNIVPDRAIVIATLGKEKNQTLELYSSGILELMNL